MKTIFKLGVASLLLAAFACKEGNYETTESADSDFKQSIASAATSMKNDNGRPFIRTADIKFKVDDVTRSTYAIENTVQKFGGIVAHTNLQTNVSEHTEVQVSPDSTLETTRYTVENQMTLRIPNRQLDTVIAAIAKEVDLLDFRIIKAEDASLQLLSKDLAQARHEKHKKRMENAIDKQPHKLNDVAAGENDLLAKQENADNSLLESLATKDKIAFSTVTLAIYQREKVKQELIANAKSVNAYRPHIGLQIWDSLKTGWFILEGILAFVAKLWSLILIAILVFVLFKKYRKPKPVAGPLG